MVRSAVDRLGIPVGGRAVGDGLRIGAPASGSRYWFVPLTVTDDLAVIGMAVPYDVRLPQVTGLTLTQQGSRVRMTWTWPPGAAEARAYRKEGAPITGQDDPAATTRRITHAEYLRVGCHLPAAATRLLVRAGTRRPRGRRGDRGARRAARVHRAARAPVRDPSSARTGQAAAPRRRAAYGLRAAARGPDPRAGRPAPAAPGRRAGAGPVRRARAGRHEDARGVHPARRGAPAAPARVRARHAGRRPRPRPTGAAAHRRAPQRRPGADEDAAARAALPLLLEADRADGPPAPVPGTLRRRRADDGVLPEHATACPHGDEPSAARFCPHRRKRVEHDYLATPGRIIARSAPATRARAPRSGCSSRNSATASATSSGA